MSRTYRDSWASAHLIFRWPKGHKKALINEVRKGATPPHAWDDKPINRECTAVWTIARKLVKEGSSSSAIIKMLMSKFNMKRCDATYVTKYVVK